MDTKTLVIQRGDVFERVAMNRVVRAPASAPIEDSSPNLQATPKDLEDKVTDGKKWVMKKILDHRCSEMATVSHTCTVSCTGK